MNKCKNTSVLALLIKQEGPCARFVRGGNAQVLHRSACHCPALVGRIHLQDIPRTATREGERGRFEGICASV